MSVESREEFLGSQQEYFAEADVTHFTWQTRGAGFREREHDFLAELLAGCDAPLLEIGSGEGGNLFHLLDGSRTGLHVGLDAFLPKLRFARREVPAAKGAAGDALALPFADASFATVLIRDVLHHLLEPRGALEEAARVLRPGGQIVLIEPNARNPLIQLQMALVEAERGARRSTLSWLEELCAGLPLEKLTWQPATPFPLDRVVLHPTFGAPSWGRSRLLMNVLRRIESGIGTLLGRHRWSYWVARATRAADSESD